MAEQLGYKMNPMVAALMAQIRAGRAAGPGTVIGLLAPKGGRRFVEKNPYAYTRRMLGGIVRRAEELGYKLEWFEGERDDGRVDAAARVAAYRGVRGLLLPPLEREGGMLEADWSPFSVVAIGQSHAVPGLHHIGHNLVDGMRMIVRSCIERGYRRMGLRLQSRYDRRTGQLVTGTFYTLLDEWSGQNVSSRWVRRDDVPSDLGWFEWVRKERLDVVITQFPEDLARARAAGFRVPDDLGLVFISLGEAPGERTGIYQDPVALGHAAVDLLTSHMHRNETGVPAFAKTVLTAPVWREGATLRKISSTE